MDVPFFASHLREPTDRDEAQSQANPNALGSWLRPNDLGHLWAFVARHRHGDSGSRRVRAPDAGYQHDTDTARAVSIDVARR